MAVSNNLGDVTIFDYDTLSKKICQLTRPKEWSEVMAYSPDETMLAIGGHDDTLYIYKIENGDYKLVRACNEFSSAVTALDWS